MRPSLSFLSAATCLMSAWMFVMYFVLRHPGYVGHAGAAALVFTGAATLLGGRPLPALRVPTGIWAAALAAVGVQALVSPSDDGWAIIAGLLFIAEGLVAFAASVAPRATSPAHRSS